MKRGLVLEGGAMRGMFTAGVIDVMMEAGLSPDGIAGVSAGACFGCNYKSGQIGRTIRYNERFCRDPRYCSLRSLIRTGDLYGVDFCYRMIPEELDIFDVEAFEQNPMEFYMVCTDVETGKPVYRMCKPNEAYLPWMRASASMPLASRIVEIDGGKYLDGGISDSVPLRFMEQAGFTKNIVVLTQPKGYVKKKNSLMPLIKMALKPYPKLIDAMAKRHEMYNETLAYVEQKEQRGEILVIRPEEKLPVGHIEHKKEKLRETYELGRKVAIARLSEIKAFWDADDMSENDI